MVRSASRRHETSSKDGENDWKVQRSLEVTKLNGVCLRLLVGSRDGGEAAFFVTS
jgi:hypothetical protein